MKIEIEIDEYTTEKMFDERCNEQPCDDCKYSPLPDEDYSGCYEKYKEKFFKSDIEKKIHKIIELFA